MHSIKPKGKGAGIMASDFIDEHNRYLHNRQHCCIMLPKFHCEFNPIERSCGQSKRYTRVYTNYTFPNLRENIPLALDTVTIENIKN